MLDLQRALPGVACSCARREVVGPIRMVKDADEIAALRAAARAVDAIAVEMRSRPFAGRTELDVHRELVERMLALGHERSNFAIVAAGEHAASPHHEPTADRVIGDGDIVLCDFGGTMHGYCSDITRMFHVGEPPAEVRDTYAVLADAQEAGVRAATVGTPCEEVDAAARAGHRRRRARRVLRASRRSRHRQRGARGSLHGRRERAAARRRPRVQRRARASTSPGRFGMRLEDIVVATDGRPEPLNNAPRDLAVVE